MWTIIELVSHREAQASYHRALVNYSNPAQIHRCAGRTECPGPRSRTAIEMEMDSNFRIRSYLAAEEPRRPRFAESLPHTKLPSGVLTIQPQAHTVRPIQPLMNRSASDASTSSYTTSDIRSDTTSGGHQSSVSSIDPSTDVRPRHLPTLDQQIARTPHDYGYDLPCEFFFVGCNLRFHPVHFEAWVSHTASHFDGSLPRKAICPFCDHADGIFRNNGDDMANWRQHMIHVAAHLEELTPSKYIRPDFEVIEHMREHGLISKDDYAYALKGTERPYCANTYPLDYELPGMQEKEQRELQAPYDMRNEERQRRRGHGTGRERCESSHPHRHRNSNKRHVEVVKRR